MNELIIKNNKFVETNDYKPIFEGLSFIDVQNCNSVSIEGNSFEGNRDVEVSASECKNVVLKKQKGFKKDIVNKPNTFFYQQ